MTVGEYHTRGQVVLLRVVLCLRRQVVHEVPVNHLQPAVIMRDLELKMYLALFLKWKKELFAPRQFNKMYCGALTS